MSFLTLSGLVISFSSIFTQLMDDKTYENDHLELDQPPSTKDSVNEAQMGE